MFLLFNDLILSERDFRIQLNVSESINDFIFKKDLVIEKLIADELTDVNSLLVKI